MPRKILEERPIPTSLAKKLLEDMNRELNQFQQRTLEYSKSFSKRKVLRRSRR